MTQPARRFVPATDPATTRRLYLDEDFEIAIICALPLEYDAVSLVLDEVWNEDGGHNGYKAGRIGRHDVILALLSGMGKANAASTAANIRSRHRRIRLAFLVGICGGVPQTGAEEILLGDVVISKAVVQYDLGRQYPHKFECKDGFEDTTSRPDKDVRNQLRMFETTDGLRWLRKRTGDLLRQLQAKATQQECGAKYDYPGMAEDKLFEPSYRHKHRVSPTCTCDTREKGSDSVCDDAVKSSCDDLGCNEQHVVLRKRLVKRENQSEKAQEPAIHIGPVGSGDTVMKSGEHRDMIAKPKGIIAFEMEGVGVAEEIPCVIVKGVCDYADCHKNKKWQNFAAATAASALKAILERYIPTAKSGEHLVEESPLQRHFLVPFGRNKDFVGRESILERLLEIIPPTADLDDCQRTAIEGLGGVGKTQIALEAAFLVRDQDPDCSVFWVPALDTTSFENAYRGIGRQLKINGIDEDKADVRSLVKTALSESAGSWLLIIDNADDVELLFGNTEATPLSEYLPDSRNGSILFTTRNHEAVVKLDIPASNVITTVEMSRDEAVEMLQRNLKDSQARDTSSTNGLLEFLADLPLAIKQASAFMAKTGMSTTKYLEHCRSSDKKLTELLSEEFEDRGRYKNIKNPVATTWLISFQHISRDKPLAVQYLRFMCFLAEKDIPASLLPPADDELDDDELDDDELDDDELDDDELEREKAIGILKAYAFISERTESNSFDMHRLVRLAMRNWLKEKREWNECITSVIQRLTRAFPFPQLENKGLWMKYLPHAQAALDSREGAGDKKAQSDLLCNIGCSLDLLGKYDAAAPMHRQALELREKMLGKEHPGTLYSMNNLAFVLDAQGKYDAAEQMHRQALKLTENVLGKEHPDTLGSMNKLAYVLRHQRKYEEAEQMCRQALKLREKVLGREHPDTLHSMDNLATLLYRKGKDEEAEQLHRPTLGLLEKILGKGHPDTLASMNNLAIVLFSQGKYDEAEQMHRQRLKLEEKVHGKEHPTTLISMHNLALVLGSQGKYEEAEQIHQQTLKLREKMLGKEHRDTLASMHFLAIELYSQGKYEEAEQIYQQTLKLREKVLGKEHPDTLESMHVLALVLGRQGKFDEAEQMHRQILKLREKVLGKEHPDTLNSMNNLALVLNSQRKFEEAEQMHRQTLKLREKVLGREHPDTLANMNTLATGLDSQGKYEEEEQMHRQTLKLRENMLGKEHPDTLDSMCNLAYALNAHGKYDAAEQMHRQALELREKVLGKEHPHTLGSMNNLAFVLYSQGKYEKAEQVHWQTLKLMENILGKEHSSTLGSMNNLAFVLYSQGKNEKAEQVHWQTLKLMENILGKKHSSTLASMGNLANAVSCRGKYEEAEQMYRQTLKLMEKVLGKEHSSTLASMNNLAFVLYSQGKYEEAEQMHRQTLKLMENVLGKEHSSTLASMNNLAFVLYSQGKYEEAEQMHRQTLKLMEKVLGKEHPSTRKSRNNFVGCLRAKEEAKNLQP